MTQTIRKHDYIEVDELVSVFSYFDHKNLLFVIKSVVWNNRTYDIEKIGFHHTFKKGETLYHVFSVVSSTVFLRLLFNTKNLNWRLMEVCYGV